jgi:DNA polymerase-1
MPATPTKLLIVDGHAYAYRAFHAIRKLSSPSGAPTNAIFGFISMLTKMQVLLAPSHRVVVWDGGLDAGRMAAHPEYKSQRPPMPTELEQQITALEGYLEAAGIASFCGEGVEADDWIASLAREHAATLPVVIASSDKDFMQLVNERIGLFNPNDKSEKVWGADDVRAKTGVGPEQLVDWLSLIGDSVDNIPGVAGVGPKTAAELLQQFGSLEKIYGQLAEVKSERLRKNLESARELVQRNQELIRLREHQPPTPLTSLEPREQDTTRLRALYAEWGFRRLHQELSPPPSAPQSTQGVLL